MAYNEPFKDEDDDEDENDVPHEGIRPGAKRVMLTITKYRTSSATYRANLRGGKSRG